MPTDYPHHVRVGGFLFEPDAVGDTAPIDPKLADFFAAARAPRVLYLGFGSMPASRPVALLQLAIDTCALLGCRCVLVAGWTSLASDERCSKLISAAAGTLLVSCSDLTPGVPAKDPPSARMGSVLGGRVQDRSL